MNGLLNFIESFSTDGLSYILEFIFLAVLFYMVFALLKTNKNYKFIAIFTIAVIMIGVAFAFSERLDSQLLLVVVLMFVTIIFTMYNTEIKRALLDSMAKGKKAGSRMSVSVVDKIIAEVVHAIQNMSKNNVGALIVLSNENLPEGIIESGTIVNAEITSQMIEAIFYPKAPLHDGAMVIEGNKIYAAGCFLPLAQSENLPKEMGSRHRAALGVTSVASVTAIVVSEETSIISIIKNGVIRKKYADASDLERALSDYYWTDLTVGAKE